MIVEPTTVSQRQLSALVVDCPELRELETGLARFNIFRVLRSTTNELRHSNMLAWLFRPAESHGLGDRFLRRWLMRVLADSPREGAPSPVEVDAAEIRSVDVFREWSHIDVLVKVTLYDGRAWVIAIENKINAKQGHKQLEKYRRRVEQFYPGATRLLVFLTMDEELPADLGWTRADYHQVYEVLTPLVEDLRGRIGEEPRVLLDHYLQTIREHAMGDEKLVELARTIYRTHQAALDFIFDQREDSLLQLSSAIEARMKADAQRLGLVPRLCQKQFIRFLPQAWKLPKNVAGPAWGPSNSAYLLCELPLANKTPTLKFVEGSGPDPWRRKLFQVLNDNNELLGVSKTKMPERWMTVFSAKLHAPADRVDVEESAEAIWKSCQELIASERFRNAVALFTPLLDELPEPA